MDDKRLIEANVFRESIEGIEWYSMHVDGHVTQGASGEETAWYRAKDIYAAIENAPTVDAVEVVRCKDCKKYFHVIGRDEREVWGCMHFGVTTKADDFCSYGERRTDNG